jgi:hypothetical protein
MKTFGITALLTLAPLGISAQQAGRQDPFLDQMTGRWTLQGTIAGQETTHDSGSIQPAATVFPDNPSHMESGAAMKSHPCSRVRRATSIPPSGTTRMLTLGSG